MRPVVDLRPGSTSVELRRSQLRQGFFRARRWRGKLPENSSNMLKENARPPSKAPSRSVLEVGLAATHRTATAAQALKARRYARPGQHAEQEHDNERRNPHSHANGSWLRAPPPFAVLSLWFCVGVRPSRNALAKIGLLHHTRNHVGRFFEPRCRIAGFLIVLATTRCAAPCSMPFFATIPRT